MRVNSIQNFSYSNPSPEEKPLPEPQNPSFGVLKFREKALENATQEMRNLLNIRVESENFASAERAIRKWFKVFTEPWDLRVARHEHLPRFVQQFEDTWIKKIYRDAIPAYNKRLASLGKEAEDLSVEVIDRVVTKDNQIAYTVNIPAMNVKNKIFKVQPQEVAKEFSMCGVHSVPTEQEISLLKRGIYEEVVGKDFATFNGGEYDIFGKFGKLLETMKS
ncbi:hypothetical protein J6S88_06395 [bacterium]|nr:hypothetical protein [bacterium]